MAVESGMGATSAKMVLEPLRKEALTKVGASRGLGAPSSGTVDGVNEAGGKREMEPLWNEATMVASSRHALERSLWKEATMTAPADVEGCESELSRSVQCRDGFSQSAELMLFFFLWHVEDHPPCAPIVGSRERERERRVRE